MKGKDVDNVSYVIHNTRGTAVHSKDLRSPIGKNIQVPTYVDASCGLLRTKVEFDRISGSQRNNDACRYLFYRRSQYQLPAMQS